MMTKLDVLYVVRDRFKAFCFIHHLFSWHEDEFSIFVDKVLDQPWAGNAVDFDIFARDPFHATSLFALVQWFDLRLTLLITPHQRALRHDAIEAETRRLCFVSDRGPACAPLVPSARLPPAASRQYR